MGFVPRLVITGAGYGLKNLGDEAFLSVMINRFRKEDANTKITVLSFNVCETKKLHNVEACNAVSIRSFLSLIRADRIVLGGGGIFDTYVGGSINLTCYYSIVVSLLGILLRKKIQFYAIGANSLYNRLVKLCLFFIMNRKNVGISVRDGDSKKELKSIGVYNTIKVVMDPAVDLPCASKEVVNSILRKQSVNLDRKLVGLTLRHTGGPQEKKVISSISKLVDWLIEEKNVEVVFIPMAKATHKKDENDLLFAQKIMVHIKNKKRFKVIRCDLTSSEVKGLIGRLDLLVGMRFHSFIFAHSTNTPFVGISYSKKVSAFLNSIGEEGLMIEGVSFEAIQKNVIQKIGVAASQ